MVQATACKAVYPGSIPGVASNASVLCSQCGGVSRPGVSPVHACLRIPAAGQFGGVPSPTIDLTHSGTSPVAWQPVLDALPEWKIDPRRHGRVVVVAPHPDDETLGVGGLLADASAAGIDIVVLSLSDGEAAFDEAGLGDRRHTELRAAMTCLAPGGSFTIERVGLPDGGLAAMQQQIADVIRRHVRPGDVLLAPLPCDGHPDHDAVGSAAGHLAGSGVELCWYPIWAWHWHEPTSSVIRSNGRRIALSAAAATAKAAALECYGSQTGGDAPILPEHFRGRFGGTFEIVVPAG